MSNQKKLFPLIARFYDTVGIQELIKRGDVEISDEKKAEAPKSDRRRRRGPTKGRRQGRGQERKRGGGEGTLQRSHRVRSSTEVEHQEQPKSSSQ